MPSITNILTLLFTVLVTLTQAIPSGPAAACGVRVYSSVSNFLAPYPCHLAAYQAAFTTSTSCSLCDGTAEEPAGFEQCSDAEKEALQLREEEFFVTVVEACGTDFPSGKRVFGVSAARTSAASSMVGAARTVALVSSKSTASVKTAAPAKF